MREDKSSGPRLAAVVYEAGKGGDGDAVLASVARTLRASGLRLAGAVQHNRPAPDRCRCDMVLEDLASAVTIEISENRGPEARGCRLNPAALEEIVGLAVVAVEHGADLLIVNKFGKREAEGRGFRQAIEAAIERGTSVLVAVSSENLAAWSEFAAGFDARLPLDALLITAWCQHNARATSQRAAEPLVPA